MWGERNTSNSRTDQLLNPAPAHAASRGAQRRLCWQFEPFCLRQRASQPVLSAGSKNCFSTCSLNINSPQAVLRLCLPSVSCFPEHIDFLWSSSSSKGLVLTFGQDIKLKHINHRFIYRISKSPSCGLGGKGRMVFRCENYAKTVLRLRC